MCRSCSKTFPDFAECHRLFFSHNGVLHRQALPRSAFNTETSYIQYQKRANKPVRTYGENQAVYVVGFGQMPLGVIKCIMDGLEPSDWYHKSYHEKQSLKSDSVAKPKPTKVPIIPEKIYKYGFLMRLTHSNQYIDKS